MAGNLASGIDVGDISGDTWAESGSVEALLKSGKGKDLPGARRIS